MTTTTKQPMMPAPASLGGGLIEVIAHHGPKPGTCTVPGCRSQSVAKCGFVLRNLAVMKTCGKELCSRHANTTDGTKYFCPPHGRFLIKELVR